MGRAAPPDPPAGRSGRRLLAGGALAALAPFALIVILLCAGLVVMFLSAPAEPLPPFPDAL